MKTLNIWSIGKTRRGHYFLTGVIEETNQCLYQSSNIVKFVDGVCTTKSGSQYKLGSESMFNKNCGIKIEEITDFGYDENLNDTIKD